MILVLESLVVVERGQLLQAFWPVGLGYWRARGCVIGLGSVVGGLEWVDCIMFMKSFVDGSGGIASLVTEEIMWRNRLGKESENCAQRVYHSQERVIV